MCIGNIRCEYFESPLSIDVKQPLLSWQWRTDRRNCLQSAYHILVASDRALLADDVGDMWDSGRVASSASVMVRYRGKSLQPRRTYYWKIRGWDEKGVATGWSEPASWTMGMLGESWPGQYIGLDPSVGDPEFPLLRRSFRLEKPPIVARAYVNALGYYELYCNGRKVDDHVLMPGPAQYDKRSYYVVHDVTDLCQEGENVVGIWLGKGWYREGWPGVAHKGPVVRGFIEFRCPDNEIIRIATDETWKGCPSHYSLFDVRRGNKFGGEKIDARERIDGWSVPGVEANNWYAVETPDIPDHAVSVQRSEPNRVVRTLHPRSIEHDKSESWRIDFGQNVVGLFSMRFQNLAAGQEVTFEFSDDITGLESEDVVKPRSTYIAGGDDEEGFENKFNYHAFRYVRIYGLEQSPDPEDVKAMLVRTDYKTLGRFRSANGLLNDVHDMIHYTFECLTLGGYMVDCPHLERLGYGGDGLASTPTAMKMHDMGALYRNWMTAWRDCQRPDGGLPHTAPNPHKAGGGPFWCAFVIGAPWYAYLHYADSRILEENYATMQRWLDGYVQTHRESNGLLMGWPDEPYRNWYLGDWAMPQRREPDLERSRHLVVNCAIVQCYEWMTHIADALDQKADKARYMAECDRLRHCVHETFFDAEKHTYADDTQLDLAYPLLVDVPPADIRTALVDRLAEKILTEHDGHLDVGLVGVSILTQALMKWHRNDLVLSYVKKKTFPSWGYMLENGATTTWEHWDRRRSRIHNCYNGVGEWFYQALGGIQPDAASPGFRNFKLRPPVAVDIQHATVDMGTPYGIIKSAWYVKGGHLTWNIRVPANTTAELTLPASSVDEVTEKGCPLADVEGAKLSERRVNELIFTLHSGSYELDVSLL